MASQDEFQQRGTFESTLYTNLTYDKIREVIEEVFANAQLPPDPEEICRIIERDSKIVKFDNEEIHNKIQGETSGN